MKHGSKDQALKLHFGPAEIDWKTHPKISGFQFVQELRFIVRIVVGSDFDLDDDFSADREIRAILADNHSLISNGDGCFEIGLMTAADQLDLQRPLIDTLEKPIPQIIVHLETRSDGGFGDVAVRQF